ncbi:MAG: hypothetical protein PHP45_05955 [Elusimicrobiales bacterium]|nr:hypothetical protein [Elusimicrobiales bacterium]
MGRNPANPDDIRAKLKSAQNLAALYKRERDALKKRLAAETDADESAAECAAIAAPPAATAPPAAPANPESQEKPKNGNEGKPESDRKPWWHGW